MSDATESKLTAEVMIYRKAAEQGNAEAQCKLGDCYQIGRGVAHDLSEAVKWYRKAAEQEDSYRMRNAVLVSVTTTATVYRKISVRLQNGIASRPTKDLSGRNFDSAIVTVLARVCRRIYPWPWNGIAKPPNKDTTWNWRDALKAKMNISIVLSP